MKSRAGWKWYGFACHCVIGSQCRFHLGTAIDGKILVSTIGAYERNGKPQEIGLGRTFETMVFLIEGDTTEGDPNVLDWSELECFGYSGSLAAEAGHYEVCERWAERIAEGRPLEDDDADAS